MGLAIAIEPMPTDLSLFGSTCYEALGQYPKLRAGVEGSGFLVSPGPSFFYSCR